MRTLICARRAGLATIAVLATALAAHAQTGVSDDRVSLPEGPGSLEGVGENVAMSGNMGTMTWSRPIPVTAGFAGVTPAVSLDYDSGAGSGVVGIGWRLGGVPMIERNTWRGLPRYDEADDFVIDGAQLVRVANDPPTYRARYEKGFVRYVWLDAGDGANGYWRADYPDGSVGYFGADAAGNLVANARATDPARGGAFKYGLVEKVDVYGHRMRLDWTLDGTYPLVQRIGYVYPEGDEPTYALTFRYEARADDSGASDLSSALGGFDLRLTRRLAEITFFVRGQRVRSHRLHYERYDDAGGFTRLTRIEQVGQRDGVYPIAFDFTYSRALGGLCGGGECPGPFVVDMGTIGVGLEGGRTNLIDINGDGLPDVLHSALDEPHVFFLNVPDADGGSAFGEMVTSDFGDANWMLDSGYTQLLDANGDGFADLINARSGRVLFNEGAGDWVREGPLGDTAALPDFDLDFEVGETELGSIRFLDYDHDKRIDVLRATRASTDIYRNLGGGGFQRDERVVPLDAGIEDDNIEFADMNGDGLLDPVRLLPDAVSYRLNLGFGRWTEWRALQNVQLDAADIPLTSLEDLNGDGLADLVTVTGGQVRVSLNRNGERFFQSQTFSSDDVEGMLPVRVDGVSVLFADMNANGSTDVVWIDREGQVDYLELYPVRPNLLSRIENGIGQVMDVAYGTSVQQQARDATPWAFALPHPMLVVESLDIWDRLSEEHEIDVFRYRDGYYDGAQKQFRGYARVERLAPGDDLHLDGRTVETYDVGAVDPYRHGLLLEAARYSDDDLISVEATTYEDCAVAEVPAEPPTLSVERPPLPVRWLCATATETLHVEGRGEAEQVRVASTMEHDGYGNVVRAAQLGVVGACGACDRDASVFGRPCGPECLGDELFTETDYAPPGARWLLGKAWRERLYGRVGGPIKETLTYFDGPAFEGLPQGMIDQGKVTRVTQRVDDQRVIQAARNAFDADGNVVRTLDPLGDAGGADHQRTYAYDAEGLRVVQTDLGLDGYTLRRETRYDPLFDKVAESTAWMRVVGGENQSSRRSSFFTYDEHGRVASRVLPGDDTVQNPTEVYVYALASPVSQVVVRRRSVAGGQLDLETVKCVDGRGRDIQTRTRLARGSYQVSGFTLYDTRSAPKRVYQPYLADSGDCDDALPEGVLFQQYRYDGLDRPIGMIEPDADLYGDATVTRTEFAPLRTLTFDGEDADPASPHADTPTVTHVDGLGRLVAVDRYLAPDAFETTTLTYDTLGRLRGYVDAAGNEKVQAYDLIDRTVRVEDPNSGVTTFEYDDAGNLVARTDARGETVAQAFDGQNRILERWDPADADGSRVRWLHDVAPGCGAAVCTNLEGKVGVIEWPGGSERFGYDARGRSLYVGRTLDGFEFVTTAAYDNADRLVATTYPDGRTIERSYDDASRLVGIDGVLTEMTYDGRDLPATAARSDGSATRWAYDARMRLAEMETLGADRSALQAYAYQRDRAGHLDAIDDTSAVGASAGALFTLDAWYRTTEVAFDDETLTWAFDAIDNVTAQRSSEGAASAAHRGAFAYGEDAGPNAVTGVGDTALTYDAAGYQTGRGATELAWDYQGRLLSVGDRAVFEYGPGELRTAKTEDGSRTLYPQADLDVRDGISTLYVRSGRSRIARYESDALATALLPDLNEDERIDAGDAVLAAADERGALLWSSARRLLMETGPELTHLHHDHLGNVTVATADGALVGKRQFHPNGTVRPGATGDVDVYGFTGQEADATTGMLRFQFRYLDLLTGRWASADPAFATLSGGNVGAWGESTTAYAYVGNMFLDRFDPLGLKGGGSGVRPRSGAKAPTPQQAKKAAKKAEKARSLAKGELPHPKKPDVGSGEASLQKNMQALERAMEFGGVENHAKADRLVKKIDAKVDEALQTRERLGYASLADRRAKATGRAPEKGQRDVDFDLRVTKEAAHRLRDQYEIFDLTPAHVGAAPAPPPGSFAAEQAAHNAYYKDFQ